MYDSIKEDIIFPSFIRSCVPKINMNELRKECYQIENNEPGNKKSNHGGYQSPGFKNTTKYKYLNHLHAITRQFTQDTFRKYNLNLVVNENSFWWLNINKSHHYNVLHCHERADLIGLFYVTLPNNSGNLVLVRNDGSQYSKLYHDDNQMINFELDAEEGRIYLFPGHLLHYVTSNESNENRISISFNLYGRASGL